MKDFIKYIKIYWKNRKKKKDFRWLHFMFNGCDGDKNACSKCPFYMRHNYKN